MILDNEQLDLLKQIELEILDAITEACDRLGIAFFLDGGTLLGAARHQGFIPRDDDIDIGMLREDYDLFLERGQEALPAGFFLQSYKSDPGCIYSFAKVRKDGTKLVEHVDADTSSHKGVWVDVFPYDWIDASPENSSAKRHQWRRWRKACNLRLVKGSRGDWSLAKRAVRRIVRLPLLVKPKSWYVRRLDSLGDDAFPAGRKLICFHSYIAFLDMSESSVLPLATLPFEGRNLPVFSDWDRALTQMYGDWRTPPPDDRRGTNHEIDEFSV